MEAKTPTGIVFCRPIHTFFYEQKLNEKYVQPPKFIPLEGGEKYYDSKISSRIVYLESSLPFSRIKKGVKKNE